jgi:predicted transposase/invertase (TIGR01784 family)
MPIGINPLIDYAFKMLFGSEEHKRLTIRFINTILDVAAEDVLGRKFNVEVQIALPAGMAKRMVFYTAETYVRRLQQGQNYTDLLPSISICVLAGALISQPAKLHLDFRLREESLPLTLTDDLQIHFLQLNHLQVSLLLPDPEFTEAAKVLDMIAQTPEQLHEYNARVKAQRDEEARVIYAQQQGMKIGEARGIEIGQARGIEIGEARGEKRGIRRGLLQGQILLLQQLLRLPTCTEDQFAAFDIDQLAHILAQLQQRFKEHEA